MLKFKRKTYLLCSKKDWCLWWPTNLLMVVVVLTAIYLNGLNSWADRDIRALFNKNQANAFKFGSLKLDPVSFTWPNTGKQAILPKDPPQQIQPEPYYPSLQEVEAESAPSTVTYFTYYDSVDTNGQNSDFILVTNPQSSSANVSVKLYSSALQTWQGTVASQSTQQIVFPDVTGGPVVITSNQPIYAVQEVISGVAVSIIPSEESPSTELMWPEYNALDTPYQAYDWIVIANPPNNTSPANVVLKVSSTTWSPTSPINPGSYTYVNFPGLSGSPVTLTSNVAVLASQRYIYADSQWPGNLTEVPGISVSNTSSLGYGSSLYWTVYDSKISNSTSVLIANPPNNTQSASVDLKVGQVSYLTNPIAPGGSDKISIPSISQGPVVLQSNIPVVATETETVGNSIVEIPGINQLSTNLVLPFYDSSQTPFQNEAWIVVANPSSYSCQASISIPGLGNTVVNISPFNISASLFGSIDSSPVEISSPCDIFASERIIFGPSPPVVSSINPQVGSVAGNTTVTVTGNNFIGPIKLYLGSIQISQITVVSSTELQFKTPAEPEGSYEIQVQNVTGISPINSLATFVFTQGIGRFPSGSEGYDISWPQCPNNFPSPPGVISIIGTDDGSPFTNNPCLLSEVSWAAGNDNLYAVIFWNGQQTYGIYPLNCSQYVSISCYAYNWGWQAAKWIFNQTLNQGVTSPVWWLDIEGAYGSSNPLWSPNVYANAYAVQGAVDFFSSQTIPGTTIKEQVGIYSSPCEWPQIVGGSDTGPGCTNYQGYSPNALEWIADWNSPTNPSQYCSSAYSFTSGPIWLVQYTDNQGGFDGDYAC